MKKVIDGKTYIRLSDFKEIAKVGSRTIRTWDRNKLIEMIKLGNTKYIEIIYTNIIDEIKKKQEEIYRNRASRIQQEVWKRLSEEDKINIAEKKRKALMDRSVEDKIKSREQRSETMKNTLNSYDKDKREEWNEKRAEGCREHWRNLSEEFKREYGSKISKNMREYWETMDSEEKSKKLEPFINACNNRDFEPSSIELKIRDELTIMKIEYETQKKIGRFVVDIYLPSINLIIECDGDYWHTREGAKERDMVRDCLLRERGYEVVRIWEHDINNNPREALLNVLGGLI